MLSLCGCPAGAPQGLVGSSSSGDPVPAPGSTSTTPGSPESSSGTGLAGSSSSGSGPTECCTSHPAPGCEDPSIEACVCELDAECCAFGWDDGCVQVALTLCGACGGGGTTEAEGSSESTGTDTNGHHHDPECCMPSDTPGCADEDIEACVCGNDPFCCESEWDDLCIQVGITNCDTRCGPPASCCEFGLDPGCSDPTVEACVCALEPECCMTEWDGSCVATAAIECGAGCKLDSGDGDCCVDNGTPGCDDPVIQACVCVDDPFCCDVVWDYVCAAAAPGPPCYADCGGGTTGGMATSGGPVPGDCCQPSGAAGCDNWATEACVCAIEDLCCTDHWGPLCVNLATGDCGLVC